MIQDSESTSGGAAKKMVGGLWACMRYLVVSAAVFVLVFGGAFVITSQASLIYDLLGMTRLPPTNEQLLGIAAASLTAIVGLIYLAIGQNMIHTRRHIRQYRVAERLIMEKRFDGDIKEKLTLEGMLTYHGSYNWGSYAALSFSTIFVIIVLIFTGSPKDLFKDDVTELSVYFAIGLLAVSAIILTLIDAIHTNTLTPLVPSDSRFRLIGLIILFGFFSILMQVWALGIFLSLFHYWLSFVVSGIALLFIVLMVQNRPIRKESVIAERGITGALKTEVEKKLM